MTVPDFDALNLRAPSVRSQPKDELRALQAPFGDGYTQDVIDGLNPLRRTWNLVWQGLVKADRDTLIDFLDARYSSANGVEAFTWTEPAESVAKTWRCRSRNPGKPERNGRYDVTAVFEEDFRL